MVQSVAAPVSNIRLGPESPRASRLTAARIVRAAGCPATNRRAPSRPASSPSSISRTIGWRGGGMLLQRAGDLEDRGDADAVIARDRAPPAPSRSAPRAAPLALAGSVPSMRAMMLTTQPQASGIVAGPASLQLDRKAEPRRRATIRSRMRSSAALASGCGTPAAHQFCEYAGGALRRELRRRGGEPGAAPAVRISSA